MAVTRHNEMALIRRGNVAAAISLAGAVLGFTLPLSSAIVHSVSVLDMVVWSVVALVVQILVFLAANLALRGLSTRIEENDVAAGITLAAASLAIGMLNAASMSY
jgi:putative membrane protein